ncbi:MAG: hypothetical protein WCW16_02495 [Candidatus Magasanikbacteria bacterium]
MKTPQYIEDPYRPCGETTARLVLVSLAFFIVVVLSTGICLLGREANAQVKIGVGNQISYVLDTKTGEGMPVGIVHGVDLIVPVGEGFSVFGEAAFATSLAKFEPALQVMVGANYKINNAPLLLGISVIYRYVHDFDGGAPTDQDIVGAVVMPAFPISDHLTLILPFGYLHNITTDMDLMMFGVRLNFAWEL